MSGLRIYSPILLVMLTFVFAESRPQNEEPFYPEPSIQDPKTPVKITLLPFYGGAKGQTLQITETMDGTVTTEVLQGALPLIEPGHPEESTHVVENPSFMVRQESEYGQNIKDIHRNALNIIRLQEAAKNKGLSEQEEAAYKEYMESLNKSAHNLAKMYEGDEEDLMIHNRAGLSGWFARKKAAKKEPKDKDKKKEEEEKKRKQLEEENKKKEAEKKKKEEEDRKKTEEDKKKAEEDKKKKDDAAKKKEEEEKKRKIEEEKKKKLEENKKKEEENKKMEENKKKPEQLSEDDKDISLPTHDDETSVAEAKPVGLAVAGIGGVASSKPVATAVVGPGGLAIARPVGTAIAGVSPDQALVPVYAEGFVVPNKPAPGKDRKPTHSTEYLSKIISKYHQA